VSRETQAKPIDPARDDGFRGTPPDGYYCMRAIVPLNPSYALSEVLARHGIAGN
jgi:hypothetical protein